MIEADVLLCDIITHEFNISPDRVVVYNQNFDAPSDEDLYIVVSTKDDKIIGKSNRFDPDTDKEVKSIVSRAKFEVELTSKNRDAYTRRNEVAMSIISEYGQRIQEDNNITFWVSHPVDLSFIEQTSALNRWVIPVYCIYLDQKQTAIEPIDKFQNTEILEEPK